ncbi:MAG TPA: hypothetical protein VJ840_06155 [Gemmatimonadaceae bacterium]|nr:hypothetical protein [Gemmatimonadaceae bacterium]
MTTTNHIEATPRTLRRVYRTLKNLPDRLLHQRRHDAVRRRLSKSAHLRRILVVCHGNVCRSPYLQAVLQRSMPALSAASAGFVGAGRAVPDASLELSARRGLDLSRFRSRPLMLSEVCSADLVIVMDPRQARALGARFPIPPRRIVVAGDLDPQFDETRAIVDPWNKSREVFHACFDRLDRCAATLVNSLQNGH